MLTFSVIIPSKNEENYIGQCIESLQTLDYSGCQFEIILADNGSTDSSVDIARSYGVKVVDLSEKETISAVRNGAAAVAKGAILVFLDADCTVARDWLQQAERYVGRNDIACFGSSPVIPDNSTWVEKTWYSVREGKMKVKEKAWQESTNMFIPKAVFEKVGGFNEELETCEDVDLSYRLADYGKIIDDYRIVAIHHRDPKTIKEFFLKEKWRGKSNYAGLLHHGVRLLELPSLILPFYFICMHFLAVILGIIWSSKYTVILIILGQIPVWLFSFFKVVSSFDFGKFFRLLLLYNIYFLARACFFF